MGPDGVPRSAGFERTRIRSDERLDYDQLDRVFDGRETAPAAVADPLALARRAAAALADRRRVGSLEIESFEPEFEFDSDGAVVGAKSVVQTEAHRLIEHLMILTNEQVAELCERRKVATLYRVHERPDPARVERLVAQLASLDVPTPPCPRASPRAGRPSWWGRSAASSRERRAGAGTGATPTLASCCAR